MKQNENKKTVSIDEILGRNSSGEEKEEQNVFNDVLDEYYAKLELQQGIVQRNRARSASVEEIRETEERSREQVKSSRTRRGKRSAESGTDLSERG